MVVHDFCQQSLWYLVQGIDCGKFNMPERCARYVTKNKITIKNQTVVVCAFVCPCASVCVYLERTRHHGIQHVTSLHRITWMHFTAYWNIQTDPGWFLVKHFDHGFRAVWGLPHVLDKRLFRTPRRKLLTSLKVRRKMWNRYNQVVKALSLIQVKREWDHLRAHRESAPNFRGKNAHPSHTAPPSSNH